MKHLMTVVLWKVLLLVAVAPSLSHAGFISVEASTREERSRLANLGFAIDEMRSDRAFVHGTSADLTRIRAAGFNARMMEAPQAFRPSSSLDGSEYTSYAELKQKLTAWSQEHSDIMTVGTLGRSLEGRDIPLVRISRLTPGAAETRGVPVVFFTGCHHAREHMSVEVPMLFIKHLVDQDGKHPDITRLLDTREIYISPMVNPDGHVFDFAKDGGKMWRKNRRRNNDGSFGVDLNRNYGFQWGTGGSSTSPRSDVYMGQAPFSEPETVLVRDFVRSQNRMKTLISFHSFSELILYPWGHTFDPIGQGEGSAADLPVFQKMARDMAQWNNYRPQQSSDLYIASGDTTDWAYGERGIFAFTFELRPKTMWDGGFYPSPSQIRPTFEENIKPMLYMIEFADDPSRVLRERVPNFLASPARQGIPLASTEDLHF